MGGATQGTMEGVAAMGRGGGGAKGVKPRVVLQWIGGDNCLREGLIVA